VSNAIFTYDEAGNVKLLERLPSRLRVVFALLCALRLLPAYQRFHSRTRRGDPKELGAMVEKLWADCIETTMQDDEVGKYSARCVELVPSEDEGWDEETQPYAEDAAAAVAYAFRARQTGNPQEAAWAARRIYESLDRYVQTITEVAPGDPEDELAIMSHPAVQAELARQQRDLADLAELAELDDITQPLRGLRERSEREARAFFDASGG
jgi:uncharacterized protein YjaG (DUF416 family)